jgi:UDP-N-acetylglucosamine 4,6-dehydratase
MYSDFLKDKVIVITGGTGSFGKTLLDFLSKLDVRGIRIISRDENKQDIIRKKLNNKKVEFYVGDVRDKSSLYNCFNGADFVFHAAALKQVPSCEFNPLEAIKTNVLGSQNVIDVSIKCNISKTILLSTDKAAMPINAMGMSKALMEKLAISTGLNSNLVSNTIFSITRYGNVMGSRGSVIPIFIELMKNNQHIPVTDLKMTRFMMSLDESIELVLYAMLFGKQGELFVQKAPSATIQILIRALEIILKKKAKINMIGPRHSEKKHETLLTSEEAFRSTDLGNYYCVKPDNRDLNYDHNKISLNNYSTEEFNSSNAYLLQPEELANLLLEQSFIEELL